MKDVVNLLGFLLKFIIIVIELNLIMGKYLRE